MILTRFPTREAAGIAAADFIISALRSAPAHADHTSLMVSGGATPVACLRHLSMQSLDWSGVSVALTDERNVPVTHAASNEKMLRETLLINKASTAGLLAPVRHSVPDLLSSLACGLIGMGDDGHFASIFPDNPDLASLLSEQAEPDYLPVSTGASEYQRTTANLALILRCQKLLLLVFGDAKREVLNHPGELPVASLLNNTQVPINVFWAP